MKNIIALALIFGAFTVSCSEEKQKNVPPADYAETEKDLIQNRIQDSANAANNTTTTANAYKTPVDSATTKTK